MHLFLSGEQLYLLASPMTQTHILINNGSFIVAYLPFSIYSCLPSE